MKDKYLTDERERNPSLHMLYTVWACKNLHEINRTIKTFEAFSTVSIFNVAKAIREVKDKLIDEDAAYAQANEILDSINDCKGGSK